MTPAPRHALPARLALTALTAVLVGSTLNGCAGPRALRSAYVDYAESFATASNQQLLLNLARLRNGHPPSFLQMGAVTAQFGFTGGLTGGWSDAQNINNGPLSLVTKTLGLTLGGSESPTFSFTPLSGGAYSKILMTPIDPNVLYSFANQNLSIALLLRLMVDRVTLSYPNGVRVVFRNRYDLGDPQNYADFLRLAANLGRLQTGDVLGLETGAAGDIRFSIDPRALETIRGYAAENPLYQIERLARAGARGAPTVELKTRSFLGVMFGAAGESLLFDHLPPDFLDSIPQDEREPVLRIDADASYTEPVAAAIRYAGKSYVISDRPGAYRNRISFLLLQLLANQTQLDPSQLPTQQLIQVR